MEDNRSKYEVKIQMASNGYVVRCGPDWFVFSNLAEAFKKIEEYYKTCRISTPHGQTNK